MQERFRKKEYQVLLQVLKRFREKANINQVDLAKKLNVQQSYISKIETGERGVDLVELKSICEALGFDLMEFIAEYQKELRKEGD